jgi:hypothetical protein
MEEELTIEHNKREKFVIDFLTEVANETNIIYLKGESGNDRVPLRIQVIIVFSLLDVFANYWCEYRNNREKPRKRCCDWYEQFCKTDRNEEFVRDKQWAILSSSQMYDLRDSIVHFFALPEERENLSISLEPNNLPVAESQNLRNEFKKTGKNILIIKPHDFHKLIKKGGIVMLKDWANNIKASRNDKAKGDEHIAGMERLWNKVNKEGAVKISLGSKKII